MDSRRIHVQHRELIPAAPYTRSGMARVALFQRLPELLEELGADADATLAAVGLARGDFEGQDQLIPYLQLEQLLLECERRTACEHFGLLLCDQSRLPELGLPGRIARCATTVGEGLTDLVRHYNLRRGGGIINLIDGGRFAQFVYVMAMPGMRDTRHYQMGAVAIAFNALEDLCGPDWQATEVRFAFRSPANVRPFQRFFRAPVRFDADESVIIFERQWLDRKLPPVGESFRREVAAEARRRRERAFDDFSGLVRDIIRKQLSIGPSSIEGVAAMLAVHRRTIDRRLARMGESYGALQRSVKYEMARQLLRETDLSVQKIADSLHFSSAANFATAFRQWSSNTPSQFRAGGP
jgi:AraC-like DNA-binding protein